MGGQSSLYYAYIAAYKRLLTFRRWFNKRLKIKRVPQVLSLSSTHIDIKRNSCGWIAEGNEVECKSVFESSSITNLQRARHRYCFGFGAQIASAHLLLYCRKTHTTVFG